MGLSSRGRNLWVMRDNFLKVGEGEREGRIWIVWLFLVFLR